MDNDASGSWSVSHLLRQLRHHGQAVGQGLLDLIYPPHCINCNSHEGWLCPACLASVDLLHPPICAKCGRPINNGSLCPPCKEAPPQIDAIRSVARFGGPLREAIHWLKYRNLQALASPLGKLMADNWKADPLPADLLIAVPLHPRRERERGYNQAHLLAEALGRETGLPVSKGILSRRRETKSQVDLNAAERKANVHGAFHCEPGRIDGRRIVLIDDVCTTGATLEACSIALRQAGAASVCGLTLARAC